MTRGSWSFIITAGGSGSRLGGVPKQFRPLGSVPLWMWSARAAEKLCLDGAISEIVLVMPEDKCDEIAEAARNSIIAPVITVKGGASRSESVMNGLRACSGTHALVHDAARPFISEDLSLRLIEKAEEYGAAIPLLASADSLKKIAPDGVISCADRREYFRTQTPQAFEREPLMQAITAFGPGGTDEAAAWIASGRTLGAVEGSEADFKITTQFDWLIAQSLAERAAERRVGDGFDIHKLVPGRRLVLAGLDVESPLGLLGHSDADVITHAVMDAILGAAGEPDIGTIFPASDNKWKDAVSTELLKEVLKRVRSKGWNVCWVDVTLIAQTPRLGHMTGEFASNLDKYISLDGGRVVNVKVKSGEGCGSVGRSECMKCHAAASLSRINIFQK